MLLVKLQQEEQEEWRFASTWSWKMELGKDRTYWTYNMDVLSRGIEDKSYRFQIIIPWPKEQGYSHKWPLSWLSCESIGTWIRQASGESSEISRETDRKNFTCSHYTTTSGRQVKTQWILLGWDVVTLEPVKTTLKHNMHAPKTGDRVCCVFCFRLRLLFTDLTTNLKLQIYCVTLFSY